MARSIPRSRMAAAVSALLLSACGGSSSSLAPPVGNVETVTIRRDEFGVPHVFAETDPGAFYGLGWAVAEDRLFQMHWARESARGRTAAVMGRGPSDEFLDSDREAVLTGYARAAERMAAELPPALFVLMVSYARGVNAYVDENGTGDHALFAQLGTDFTSWTPADTILVWLWLSRHFTPSARPEIQNYVFFQNALANNGGDVQATIDEVVGTPNIDDAAATVLESDVDPALRAEMQAYADGLGISLAQARLGFDFGHDSPKFSHAWAVGGNASATGSTMLFSDPQAPILVPAMFAEWHVVGETFDARGVSPPGSLTMIVGSTPDVVWGATSSGADQRDLFLLQLDDFVNPTMYELDGAFRPFEVMEDVSIEIAGESPEVVTYRETIWGPVVTELYSGFPIAADDDWEGAALRAVMLSEEASFVGIWDMFHARTADEVRVASEGWAVPSLNLLFGDRSGDVGYIMKGRVPVRSPDVPLAGRVAHEGNVSSNAWLEYVPNDYLPWVVDPASDSVLSGNHLPVGSWYPIPLGVGTGGSGDTGRSRRIRELMEGFGTLDVDDMTAIHTDVVNPGRRDIALLGEYLRREGVTLSGFADAAVDILETWLDLGAPMTDDHPGAALAHFFDDVLRPEISAELTDVWGGGENGLQFMLKTRLQQIEDGEPMPLTAAEVEWVIAQLEKAIQEIRGVAGSNAAVWPDWYRAVVLTREVQPWTNLDNLPSLIADAPVTIGPMICADENTVLSQFKQLYSQRIVLGQPELLRTLLPLGQSERDPAHLLDQADVHRDAELKVMETVEADLITAGAATTLLEFDPDA